MATNAPPSATRRNTLTLDPDSRVAIVGGGFSGTIQAINLLRFPGPRVLLVERRPRQLARGVAYSAAHPAHLLNVRAGNMSALADDPTHFARWLEQRTGGAVSGFVPRMVYGEYLQEMLEDAARRAGDRLELVIGDVRNVRATPAGEQLVLNDGGSLVADVVVLAAGNLPPHDPPGFGDHLDPDRYAADPWAVSITRDLAEPDRVLMLGTGLTAIDAALLLDEHGFRGRITALSRRGLTPRAHWDHPRDASNLQERPAEALSQLTRFVRRRAARRGWRDAVDDLRPITQLLWASATPDVRRRFLRHLRPYWDVHRHRIAPEIAARIDALRAEGRLEIIAGRTIAAEPEGDGLRLTWRARAEDRTRSDHFRRAVNCTGPQGDLLRSEEPLLRTLLNAGRIRPDPLRLGVDVDAQSRLIDSDGKAQERLLAIGPMTRGGLWEVVAVPDLRNQTWNLARRLANAHWVGGEGL